MSHMPDAVFESPVGYLGLFCQGEFLVRLQFLGQNAHPQSASTPLLREAKQQLEAWFKNPHHCFTLPCKAIGSDFRHKVWQQIAAIPCGEVKTYADLARALQTAPRAVGGACGANPLPLIVPCHRVVAASGLGGFNSGRDGQDWLAIKRWLLANEQKS